MFEFGEGFQKVPLGLKELPSAVLCGKGRRETQRDAERSRERQREAERRKETQRERREA